MEQPYLYYTTWGDGGTPTPSILPKELQACEYLETDGNCYIILPYTNTTANNVKVKIGCDKDNSVIFGARFAANQQNYYIQNYLNYKRIGFGSNANNYNTTEKNFIFERNGSDLYIRKFDGTIIHHISDYSTFAGNINMIAFGVALPTIATAQSGTKIYTYEINGNISVACYVKSGKTYIDNKSTNCPAGTPGMYDVVNNIFYTNDGTGAFTVGPDIIL